MRKVALVLTMTVLGTVAATADAATWLWFKCGQEICRSAPDGKGAQVAVPAPRIPLTMNAFAVSPDGARVIVTGNNKVALGDVASPAPLPLLHTPFAQETSDARWRSDGQLASYREWRRGYALTCKVDPAGADRGCHSARGDGVAFGPGDSMLRWRDYNGQNGGGVYPVCIDQRGTCGASVANVPGGRFVDDEPAISPDGKLLATSEFSLEKKPIPYKNENYIGLYDTATAVHLRDVVVHPSGAIDPAWTPDGKWIAYAAEDPPSESATQWSVFAVAAAGGAPVRLVANATMPQFSVDPAPPPAPAAVSAPAKAKPKKAKLKPQRCKRVRGKRRPARTCRAKRSPRRA